VKSRVAIAILALLLVATYCQAETLVGADMTWWELLWYRGGVSGLEPRWWHGTGWCVVVLGLPTALATGLAMFGFSRAARRLLGVKKHNPRMQQDSAVSGDGGDEGE